MKLHIQSDGTLKGTKIETLEGIPLEMVQSFQIHGSWQYGNEPRGLVNIILQPFDVIMEADVLVTVVGGKRYWLKPLEEDDG